MQMGRTADETGLCSWDELQHEPPPPGADSQPARQLLIDGVAGCNVRLTVTKL